MALLEGGSFHFEGDLYFNPQLQLDGSLKKNQVAQLLNGYRLNKAVVGKLHSMLSEELQYGLLKNPPRLSAFPMINTFVAKFPKGTEVGHFLGLDIGGTNMRIVYIKLDHVDGQYKKSTEFDFFDVPLEVRQGTGDMFFGFFANCLQKFLQKRPHLMSLGIKIPLGFTFSFGYEQHAIDRGEILQFGIQTNVPDVLHKCPVQLLQSAIDKLNLPVKIVALANDATTTLIAGRYEDQQTVAGLILGSGTNVAYIEKIVKYEKISNTVQTFGYEVDQFVVNSEFGLFGDNGQMDFAKVEFDHELDRTSMVPKSYTYEKIVGGAFLGDLLRITLTHLIKKEVLLSGRLSEQLSVSGSIGAADISAIEIEFECNGSNARVNSQVTTLLQRLGYENSQITDDDRAIITYACQVISLRSAIFIAIAVSIFAEHIEQSVMKFACDGSLFRKHPKINRMINAFVAALSPTKQIEVFSSDQGSSIGAALLAAVITTDSEH